MGLLLIEMCSSSIILCCNSILIVLIVLYVFILFAFCRRAKLFRFDTKAEPPEWKERGTGEVKFLRHMKKSQVRLLMRRDKTHKVCANHFSKFLQGVSLVTKSNEFSFTHNHSSMAHVCFNLVTKEMALMPNAGSDKAWVWTVQADYADEQPKVEQLAIKFKNAESKSLVMLLYIHAFVFVNHNHCRVFLMYIVLIAVGSGHKRYF